MGVLSTSTSVYNMHAHTHRSQKRVSDPLRLELQSSELVEFWVLNLDLLGK